MQSLIKLKSNNLEKYQGKIECSFTLIFLQIKMMNINAHTSIQRLLTIVAFLLGFLPFLSQGGQNSAFYLMSALSVFVFFSISKEERNGIIFQLKKHPLIWIIAVWLILLYSSILYSDGSYITQYARKYKKYIFIFLLAFLWLYALRNNIELIKNFWLGFITGGFTLFILNTVSQFDLLKLIPLDYFTQNIRKDTHWMPIDLFFSALSFSGLFGYGFIATYQKKWKIGIITMLIGIFMVTTILEQRSGYIALWIMICWLIWCSLPRKISIGALVTIILITIGIFNTNNVISKNFSLAYKEFNRCYQHLDRSHESIPECKSSNGYRMIFYYDALQQIKKSPWIGNGLGSVDIRRAQKTGAPNIHNEYLMQGVQLGIVGILLLITIFAVGIYSALKIKDIQRYFYSGIVLMYVAVCLFESFLYKMPDGTFFATIISIIIAQSAYSTDSLLRKDSI